MGKIRLLLALSVVLAHSSGVLGTSLVGGRTAVECFFVISGYYMAMVMAEKYGRLRQRLWSTFMASRAVRLYPVYLVVLALTLVFLVSRRVLGGEPPIISDLDMLSPVSLVVLLISNLTMIGQDLVLFAHLDGGGNLAFIGKLHHAPRQAHTFLLIPQAWSLSVELCFYAMAPWLLRRADRVLVVVLGASIGLRIALIAGGFGHDPWSYRLFPVELSLFVAGALAYRWGGRLRDAEARWLGPVVFATVVAACVAYTPWLVDRWSWLNIAFPLAFAPAVPVLFGWTAHDRRDRWIGELSFPVYVVHVLVLDAMLLVGLPVSGIAVAPASVAAAIALLLVVDAPVERRRQARLAQLIPGAGQPVPGGAEPAFP